MVPARRRTSPLPPGEERALDLLVVGTSHTVAPAAVRDRMALSGPQVRCALRRIRGDSRVPEAVLLSTCTRTEVYGWAPDVDGFEVGAWKAVADVAGAPGPPPGEHTYRRGGRDAVRHLFRVASGLDSLILGEHQILGQVRDALGEAEAAEALDSRLSRLFQAAIHTGRRARSETRLGRGPVSIPCAAARLVRRWLVQPAGGGGSAGKRLRDAGGAGLADPGDARLAVVGAGATGASVAGFLARLEPRSLVLVNRTASRAQAVAARLGAGAAAWSSLASVVGDADAVVTATSARRPILDRALLDEALAARDDRPLLVVDLASPRNVEPSAAGLPGLRLHDLDHLDDIVRENLRRRASEVPRVEAIVDEAVARWEDWERRRALHAAAREAGGRPPEAPPSRSTGTA